MAEDWSLEEVEATVADYFSMLEAQWKGEQYSKSGHRRMLQSILKNRSEGAIEFKHRNISAVLRDVWFPWVDGTNRREIIRSCSRRW
ncbi:MAG: hypothetical protein ABI718_11640 [Acidobacteriota bacterium]